MPVDIKRDKEIEILRLKAALEMTTRQLEMLSEGGIDWARASTKHAAEVGRRTLRKFSEE